MAFSAKRAEITAAIAELNRLQMEAIKDATFGGWTLGAEVAFDMRAARIAALCRELAVFEGTVEPGLNNPYRG